MSVRVLLLALALAFAGGARAEAPEGAGAEALAHPLDLNTATVEELQRLPGIGPKKAAAIVAARQKRPFTRLTQLLEVRGIGRRTLERLKPFVRVGQGG